MKKRGVEMSMNVIVVAAIVLIILVLLVMFVTGAFSRVKDGTTCESKPNGRCVTLYEGQSCADAVGEDGYVSLPSDCPDQQTCCWKAFEGRDDYE